MKIVKNSVRNVSRHTHADGIFAVPNCVVVFGDCHPEA
jgi:hypothetical protein